MGADGNGALVRLAGHWEKLSLDRRGRFRLPDHLANVLREELIRVRQQSSSLDQTSAGRRLAFYLVPGTRRRIFLYPVPNISLAIDSFENPPPGMDHELVRRARDYFYDQMRFVEADKQNRLLVPDRLRQHAEIDETVEHVVVAAHNNRLELTRSDLAEERLEENKEAFQQTAAELLDPAYPRASSQDGGEGQD